MQSAEQPTSINIILAGGEKKQNELMNKTMMFKQVSDNKKQPSASTQFTVYHVYYAFHVLCPARILVIY